MSTERTTGRTLLVALLLLAAAFVAYFPVLGSGFLAWDDPETVVGNPAVAGAPAAGLLTIWTEPVFLTYLPVWFTSLWIDNLFFGEWAPGYHAVNLLLHFLNALVLLFVVRRLSKSDFIAGAAAVLFVLHPAATESVAWISERKGLLAFLFSSLAILSFLRAVG
ncbi:MAG: hypothetical protein ABFS86_21280, partial [Planctomycetota bacterium]